MSQNNNKTYKLAVVGLMAAVAFVSNYFSIPIGDVSRVHLGNGFCVLSGILLGPVAGGLSAGLGGFFFDLTNPLYAKDALFTFAFKFIIGFVAGAIANSGGSKGENKIKNFTGALVASLSYMALYLGKSFISEFYFYRNPMETVMVKMVTKATSSSINAVAAVVIAMILVPVFIKAMKQARIYDKIK